MRTRCFLRSLTVVVAAVSLSLAAHATSAAAAEHDHGGSSRPTQRDPIAARERSHDDDEGARHRAAPHRAEGSADQEVAESNRHRASVLTATGATRAQTVHAIAPRVAPAPPPGRAQPIAVVVAPHPYPPLLVIPTAPVAPPASGSVVIGAAQPPLNLATIITLVVAGAMGLLAAYLARRPA